MTTHSLSTRRLCPNSTCLQLMTVTECKKARKRIRFSFLKKIREKELDFHSFKNNASHTKGFGSFCMRFCPVRQKTTCNEVRLSFFFQMRMCETSMIAWSNEHVGKTTILKKYKLTKITDLYPSETHSCTEENKLYNNEQVGKIKKSKLYSNNRSPLEPLIAQF